MSAERTPRVSNLLDLPADILTEILRQVRSISIALLDLAFGLTYLGSWPAAAT